MPRMPGKLHRDGDSATAKVLVDALTAAQTDRETAETLTHPFHTYPARLHPATARVLVEFVGEGATRTQPIVDPFCGSGTVLVEARAAGLRAIGSDLNPLAVLVARARRRGRHRRGAPQPALREAGHAIAGAAPGRRQGLARPRSSGRRRAAPANPPGSIRNARDRRLKSWFAPHVRRELEESGRADRRAARRRRRARRRG